MDILFPTSALRGGGPSRRAPPDPLCFKTTEILDITVHSTYEHMKGPEKFL